MISIAVITATDGHNGLYHTGKSILSQMQGDDEWLIIDRLPYTGAKAIVNELELLYPGRCKCATTRAWNETVGIDQRNLGIALAKADLLLFLNDGDVLQDKALATIRRYGVEKTPMMFSCQDAGTESPIAPLTICKRLWSYPYWLNEKNVVGQMFVLPNIPERLQQWHSVDWPLRADYDFIVRNLMLWPWWALQWCQEIICTVPSL